VRTTVSKSTSQGRAGAVRPARQLEAVRSSVWPGRG
jgi:hypothetical protein